MRLVKDVTRKKDRRTFMELSTDFIRKLFAAFSQIRFGSMPFEFGNFSITDNLSFALARLAEFSGAFFG